MTFAILKMAVGVCVASQIAACAAGHETAEPRSPASPIRLASTESTSIQAVPASTLDGEERACAGVSQPERESGPLPGQVIGVEPLRETTMHLKFAWTQLRGAKVFVRASRGMTKQWLAHLAKCHMAHVSHGAGSEGASDPLSLGPVEVSVADRSDGFVVYLRTEKADSALANRVLETSKQLLSNR